MGLDVVELVMNVEDTFLLDLPDDECGQIRTVGDLYRLILNKLDLPYQPASVIEKLSFVSSSKFDPWTTPRVWITLKHVIADQLQVDENEIRESSGFQDDLGAD